MAATTGGTPTKTVVVHAQQRWEYVIVNRRSDVTLSEELNTLGQRGWELVNALNYRDMKGNIAWSAFLKRPISGQTASAAEDTPISSAALGGGATGLFGGSSSSIISSGFGSDSSSIGTDSAPKEVKVEKPSDVRVQGKPPEPPAR
jgi:hypothetical protein